MSMKFSIQSINRIIFLISISASLPGYCQDTNSSPESVAQEYITLAKTVQNEGNNDKSLMYYQKALELNPRNFEALFNSANILFGQEKIDQAIAMYEKALVISPQTASIHFNLGICASQQNNVNKAIASFEKTVELNPSHTKAYQQLINMHEKQQNYTQALECAKKALALDPYNVDALSRTAAMYKHVEDFNQAIEMYRRAVKINPKNVHCILDLANTLNMVDELDEALGCYQQILEINPNIHEALYNFGFTLKKKGEYPKAIQIFKKLIELKPQYAQPHFSLALSYLTLGDFEQGWPLYEWRWQAYNEKPRTYQEPLWTGQDLRGKTILLYAEQGLGDTFQFVRYAQLIKERGGTIIFETQKPLKTILSLCPYLDKVVVHGEPKPSFDYQLPLMSLPLAFNTKIDTVPTQIPYLYADQKLVEHWHKKLSSDTNFKVGICWQGNSQYSTQFLRRTVAAKSISINKLLPLLNIPGVTVYNLQKITGEDQLKNLPSGTNLISFGDDLDTEHGRFMDTAAIIKNLDLVITVDTSISHFAAALGCPTWIILPQPADWRWMLNRNDTPWYPNVRLFRQQAVGNWDSAIQNVISALLQLTGQQESNEQLASINNNPESEVQEIQLPENLADLIENLTALNVQSELKRLISLPDAQLLELKNAIKQKINTLVCQNP